MVCENCGKEFFEDWRKDPKIRKTSCRFCCRNCSNSRKWSEKDKKLKSDSYKSSEKVAKAIEERKGKHTSKRIPREKVFCKECGKEFERKINSSANYCGKKCVYKNAGGYREGSGHSKTGRYKGIYCGSTYELAWVIYSLDHNVKFTRFSKGLKKDGLTYFPDFLIENTIIEIKGYDIKEQTERKTNLAKSFGYEVIVKYKEDLKEEFDWVKKNYKYKKMQELYDKK